MDGERFVNWNFVASRRKLIDATRTRVREQRFAPVPSATECIPPPD